MQEYGSTNQSNKPDDDEPVLCPSPISKDSSKCISSMDSICSRVLPDEPDDPSYGIPICQNLVEISQVACFDFVLVYSISTGAGNKLLFLLKDVV
jgi:hypothetical protein